MSFTPGRGRFPPQSYGGSRGGRAQRPQYPRSARNTPFASYDGWGSPPTQGLYPVDELGPTPAPGPGPGGWETGRTHPEEYHYPGYEEEFQQTPFHGLPRDLQLDDSGWGRTQGDWYGWGGADGDRRGYSDLPRSFVDDSDALRSRIRWRDELLTGDPQKAMDEHASETSTLVISFVTRGSPSHPHGQGCAFCRARTGPHSTDPFASDEILFFKPRPKDANRYQLQRA